MTDWIRPFRANMVPGTNTLRPERRHALALARPAFLARHDRDLADWIVARVLRLRGVTLRRRAWDGRVDARIRGPNGDARHAVLDAALAELWCVRRDGAWYVPAPVPTTVHPLHAADALAALMPAAVDEYWRAVRLGLDVDTAARHAVALQVVETEVSRERALGL